MEKIIVITGASAGIGAAMARLAAKRGNQVVLAARREAELKKVADECGGMAVVTDVTQRDQVDRLAQAALAKHARIDVWINNAGRAMSRAAAELTDEDIDEMMLANVKSVLYGMRAVLPHMKQRNAGQIINVSSMLGRIPFASVRAAYSAAKHAMMSLTANFRADLQQTHPGIHISTLIPGVVQTDFGLNAKYGGPDNRNLPGSQPVEEVAEVALDLIEHPRAEAYTRPQYRELIKGYYSAEDVSVLEAQWGRR
jgi:NADP-dependent 3-hydroxy acid dehydrogenase YdfG